MHSGIRFAFRQFTIAALCGLMAWLSARPASAQDTMTVPCKGRVSWAQMLEAEREARSLPRPVEEAIPLMPGPAPREIGRGAAMDADRADLEDDRLGDDFFKSAVGAPCPAGLLDFSLQDDFLGLLDNGASIPPDTMGAVGPNHVMTMLNPQVRIQNRAGGVISTVSDSTFWTSGTGLTGNPFDPKVVYDSLSDRWIATCVADGRSASSAVFFAISDTDDPTDAWSFYEFDADATDVDWADYPGLGVNGTWIAITENMFTVSGSSFSGVKMWVIDKSTALAGGALTLTVFGTGFDSAGGFDSFTMQPCLTFDAAEPNLYIASRPGVTSGGVQTIRISQLTGTGPSPSWSVIPGSVFPGSGLFLVANNFNSGQIDADQPDTTTDIETNDPRMLNAVFRNGRIWCTHSGGLPASGTADRTAVFWYEIDPLSGTPIVQSGVVDGGVGVHHYFPSISVNCADDMCVGFTRSDATRYAEAVYTGRLAVDATGTTRPIVVAKPGESAYSKFFSGTRNRWGDYSATVVDPVDDTTFWTLQEYAAQNNGPGVDDGVWGTWWAKVGLTLTCLGDSNIDGFVDILDLLAVIAAWGPCPAPCPEDNDFTGTVDILDLLNVIAGWGPCPVANDDLVNAIPITDDMIDFNNAGATDDGPTDCAGLEKDMWYCYTASCTGDATISLCGSTFDTVLAVYDGCADATTLLACNDDFCSTQSEMTIAVTSGQDLLIRIGGKSGASGAGTLDVSCVSNDDCETPEVIGIGNTAYSTLDATASGPALPGLCDEGSGLGFAPDVWFLYTPVSSGTLTVSTCNQADYDTRLAAYTGSCGSLVIQACNDDATGCSLTSEMIFPVIGGVDYRIRTGGWNTEVGTGTLTLSFSLSRPKNVDRASPPSTTSPKRQKGGVKVKSGG